MKHQSNHPAYAGAEKQAKNIGHWPRSAQQSSHQLRDRFIILFCAGSAGPATGTASNTGAGCLLAVSHSTFIIVFFQAKIYYHVF